MYYVSTSGYDGNDGLSELTPFATIGYAASVAVDPGGIIALKKGDVWGMSGATRIDQGGTAGNPVVWDGGLWGTGDNAMIRAAADGTDSNHSLVNITRCQYLTFQNITVDGNGKQMFGLVIGGGPANYFSPGSDSTEREPHYDSGLRHHEYRRRIRLSDRFGGQAVGQRHRQHHHPALHV